MSLVLEQNFGVRVIVIHLLQLNCSGNKIPLLLGIIVIARV